jgi:hypothetical protein
MSVLEQALEALERCTKHDDRDYDAIAALKEAIKHQGEAKPVGVTCVMHGAEGYTMAVFDEVTVPVGTKLYKGEQP